MSFSQLEINKFSAEGELLRRIRCLAGRVSVFRSQSESEIEKFKKALEGKSQSDRFSILLDGSAYYPEKHCYIGFGPFDSAPSAITAYDYLLSLGVDAHAVEATLVQFGLGGLSRTPCNGLEPNQWKMLRMAGLCVSSQIQSVVVLHDPFETIPEQYRDVFADKLAKAAWEKNVIMVITKLSYRPGVWIENDHIARVQLERPRQGTIGFGGGELSSAEAMANLRKELGITEGKAGKLAKGEADLLAAPARSLSQRLLPYIQSPITMGFVVCSFVLIGAVFYTMIAGREALPTVQATQSSVVTEPNTNPVQSSSTQVGTVVRNQQNTPAKKQILSGYPQDIQLAWAAAIDDPASLFKRPPLTVGSSSTSDGPQTPGGSPIRDLYNALVQG